MGLRSVLIASALAASLHASAAAPGFLDQPADKVLEAGSALVNGHDFLRLIAAALKVKAKGEFETSEEYRARVAEAAVQPVYGSVTLGSALILSLGRAWRDEGVDSVWYDYDTDSGKLKLCASRNPREEGFDEGEFGTTVELSFKLLPTGTYQASNAYGAKVLVRKSKITKTDVFMRAAPALRNCSDAIAMTPSEAKAGLPNARFMVVGHLGVPMAERRIRQVAPSYRDPVEQDLSITRANFVPEEILLVSSSGRILARAPYP